MTDCQRSEDPLAAERDALTGLLNYQTFGRELEAHTTLVACGGGPCSVLFIGIDDFNIVSNSVGGRAAGDAVVQVARRLAGQSRPGDAIARLGTDEFGVLLPDTTPAAAADIAENLLRSLRAEPVVAGGIDPIAASIGIAALRAVGKANCWKSVANAEAAMFDGQRQGGDRVVMFDHRFAESVPRR